MLSKYKIILAVAAFIINKEKKLLIVKKSPYEKVDGGKYTVPGGKVKASEPIVKALFREIKEEVNLEITEYKWIGEDVFLSNEIYFHGEHFLCKIKDPKEINLENNLLCHRWIGEKDIEKYDLSNNIKKEIVSIFSYV